MKTEHAYTDAAQRREEEVREHISWFREFLTFGTELPETIRRQYGLEEDYRRYMELAERDNRMFEEADGTEYRRHMEKIRKGEIPGPGKAYTGPCRRDPDKGGPRRQAGRRRTTAGIQGR